MKQFLIFVLLFPAPSFAKEWICSNWKPVFSPILIHTGARSHIVRLSEPTSDLRKAKEELFQINSRLAKISKSLNYDLQTLLVKSDEKYQIILTECWTESEAANILLKFDGKVSIESFRADTYHEVLPSDCVHCGR